MHLETSQGSSNYVEVDEVEYDAPTSPDSDDGVLRNGFHEESDNADNESSDNDDELPYNVEAFINPVYDIEEINIDDNEDASDHDSHTGEAENSEPNYYDWNFVDQEGSLSSSEMSDEYLEEQGEIVEPNNVQQDASNNPENENLNNVQQGALGNVEISNENDINPNLFNDDCTECIFIVCDDECIEPIAISTSSYGTSFSSNMYNGPYNSGFETPESPNSVNYCGPGNPGYPSSYLPYYGAQGNAGYTQSSEHCTSGFVDYETPQSSDDASEPPVFNTSFSSRHHASGNPGYATLQLLPPYSLLNNPRYPTSHYHLSAAGRCCPTNTHRLFSTNYHGAPNNRGYLDSDSTDYSDPENQGDEVPYSMNYNVPGNRGYPDDHPINHDAPVNQGYTTPPSTNYTAPDNREYPGSYFFNFDAPDDGGNTGSRSTNYTAPDNYGYLGSPSMYVAPTPRNDAIYRTPQASGYDSFSDKLASETTQSTNYIAPGAPADGTAKASAYEESNASGYGTPTSFDQSEQLSPVHDPSVPPAYLGPHSYDYGNLYSSNYIAPDSSRGTTLYSQHGAPSSGYPAPECPDTPDVSENVASQSPVPQVLSNDEASGSTASYNYRGPDTTGYGTPGRFAYTALSSFGYEAPIFTGYGVPGFYGDPRYGYFCYWGYLGYSIVDFNVYSGPDSLNYGSPNSAGYDASGMSGSSTQDTSNFLPQNSPTYDQSNTDHRSPGSSAYWIGNDYNLSTIFDSNGHLIGRNDMENSVMRFLVSNERYIPVVRFQSEATAESNDGNAELGHSGGPSGRRRSFSSGSQTRSGSNSTRSHGCSRGDKHGHNFF